MRLSTQGIIIRDQNIGEKDRLVTVLTSEYGVIRAFVKGAKNLKSKLNSSTQLFCYSNMSIFKSKDKYIIDEAESISVFFNLRMNIEKLSLAQYFAELAIDLIPNEQNTRNFLRLFLNSVHLLAESKLNDLQIKSIYELRIMSFSGYAPDLLACSGCGKYESDIMYFNIGVGALRCETCGRDSGGVLTGKSLLAAMRHIVYSSLEKLFFFTIPDDTLKTLADVAEQYTLTHLQKEFKTLSFYKSLFEQRP